MDKLKCFLIPFIYLFGLTLNILTVSKFFMSTPYAIVRSLKNGPTWTTKFSLQLILFFLSGLHSLVQTPIIKLPLNIVQKLPIVHIFYTDQSFISVSSNIKIIDVPYGK